MDFKKIEMKIENFGKNHYSYWGNALAGETGELCNIIKKIERDNIDPDKFQNEIKEELADVFIYTALIARVFHIDLEQSILEKLKIIEIRREKNQ